MTLLPPLRDVIARHGLQAKKALGQNFLLDEQLLDRIAALAGEIDGHNVIEIACTS
jgi:16S rRNA (adenine1518-N6/adenine1519-N6)-dimethyltransferase